MHEVDQNNLNNKENRDYSNHKNNPNNDSFIGKILFHKYTLIKKFLLPNNTIFFSLFF